MRAANAAASDGAPDEKSAHTPAFPESHVSAFSSFAARFASRENICAASRAGTTGLNFSKDGNAAVAGSTERPVRSLSAFMTPSRVTRPFTTPVTSDACSAVISFIAMYQSFFGILRNAM